AQVRLGRQPGAWGELPAGNAGTQPVGKLPVTWPVAVGVDHGVDGTSRRRNVSLCLRSNVGTVGARVLLRRASTCRAKAPPSPLPRGAGSPYGPVRTAGGGVHHRRR